MAGDQLPWHILGAGSVGCLWAAYLSREDHPVTLILKNKKSLKHYQEAGGITLYKGDEQFHTQPNAMVADDKGKIDKLLVTVKAHQTLAAIHRIADQLCEDALVLLLQNGMGVAGELKKHYPHLTVLLGSTTDGIYQKKRFHVVHAGQGSTWIGEGYGKLKAKKRNMLLANLGATDQNVQWDQDINERMWHKLAINCAINAATALVECRNGHLADSPEGLELLDSICDEITAVFAALEIDAPQPSLRKLVKSIAQKTGQNYSSMHQDLHNGRHTEIDYINGYLCKRAQELGIHTPANKALVNLIKLKEQLLIS